MKFSEFICEELNTDAQKAIPQIKEFFKKWFKKFKIDVKSIDVEILQNTRFGIAIVGTAKDADNVKKLRSKLPFSYFKNIDGREFEFIRLRNVRNEYAIEYDERSGSFEICFHIERKEIKNFYRN